MYNLHIYICVCVCVCMYVAFPGGKESTCQCRRHGFDPWVGKISGVGNGNPLQYSCLGNSMNIGAWPGMHACACV